MQSTFGQLREILLNEFTETEVTLLCSKMGIDFEHLAGTGFFGKTRELLVIIQQQDRLPQLRAHMKSIHPQAFDETEQPSSNLNQSTVVETDQQEEEDAEDDEIENEPNFAGQKRSLRDVARETEKSYVVTPQLRTLFLITLIAVIAIFGALVVFLPGMIREKTLADVPATATIAATATSSIPVIKSVSVAAPKTLESSSDVVVIATQAPITNTAGNINSKQVNKVPTTPAIPDNLHPAIRAVQEANSILPAFYRGELSISAVSERWTGKAYKITVDWNEKLPIVMKLKQVQRSSLVVNFDFVKQPTLISDFAGAYTVTTREYWAYTNPSAEIKICDTRDYVYTVLEVNGRYMVTTVTSKIIDKLCR